MPLVAAAAVPAAAALVAEPGPRPGTGPTAGAGDPVTSPRPVMGDHPRATDHARAPCSTTSLRAIVAEVLDRLPPFDVAVLLAGGPEPLLHAAPVAVAEPQGASRRQGDIAVDGSLLVALARRGQAPRAQSSVLGGALGTLALLLHDARPGHALVPVSIAARAEVAALDAVAVGIASAIDADGRDVVVLTAGDLANAAAAPDDDVARQWDDHAASALAMGDHAALRALGPGEAAAVGATGWAPLTVSTWLMTRARLDVTRSSYLLSGGVGRFTALAEPAR